MKKGKTFEEFLHLIIQAALLVCFVFYWLYLSQYNRITEFIVFVAPLIILISLTVVVARQDRKNILERMSRNEEELQITIHRYDELRHDLIAFAAAIVILIIARIFSLRVNIADILQALVALIMIYLVKTIYFGRIR